VLEPLHTVRCSARRSLTGVCAVSLALCACSSIKPNSNISNTGNTSNTSGGSPNASTNISAATPGPTAPAAPQSAADQRAAGPAALGLERQWLQSWFKDTPVRIAQRSDGAVTVDVPVAFCFDSGRSTVKPALAAVLDKVAESMRRVPSVRMPLLAAPEGTPGSVPLAAQRAQQMQKHLLSRGVTATRLGPSTASSEAAVQLRIEAASPA
jgi:outer membrane protein OmpA-like peptidoglycan-associated protein